MSMKSMARTLVAIVCGFTVGLALGPISLLSAAVSDKLMRGWDWPEFNTKAAIGLLASSVPAGINGAIGAGLAAARGNRRRVVISVFPIGLHVAAGILAMVNSPSEFLLLQLLALLFSVVVWPAGRLGQMIGWTLRSRNPELAASKQEVQLTNNAKDGSS
jgi:hypothetical protein